MKKCYIVPNVHVLSVEMTSMICESLPTSLQADEADSNVATFEDDMESRQRGGDYGSLW